MVQSLETSTRCARVVTDEGVAFLKGLGNPAGNGALASELVCAELASWLGLLVPDFAILEVSDLPVPMIGHGDMLPGPAFASRLIEGGPDIVDEALPKLINKGDPALLIIFDSWVRNIDRYPPDGTFFEANYDNLFFTPVGRGFRIVALDHSHCFVEGVLEQEVGDNEVRADQKVYGRFPEFQPYISESHLFGAAERLRLIEADLVREIVASVPVEWGLSSGARAAWVETICARAQLVAQTIPDALAMQGRLGL